MPATADAAPIGADIASLRRRVEALNDPRLDGVASRLFAAEAELRRVANPSCAGHVERFGR